MRNIMLGCDPEAFLVDVHGQLKSSIGLIGGSKEMPRPLFSLGDGFAVQEDNVALEFNIPPAEGRSQYIERIQRTLNFLTSMVKEGSGLTISQLSAASFPESELQDPAALVFGCDPDYNAWTLDVNPKPSAEDKNLRSCGGHVHVGYDVSNGPSPTEVVRMMDLHLGVPSVLMDKGDLRKNLYGKAGAHRLKPYGVEYRTLSNFWIFSEKTIGWVWDNTARSIDAADKYSLTGEDSELVQRAINTNDRGLAETLVNRFKLEVVHV